MKQEVRLHELTEALDAVCEKKGALVRLNKQRKPYGNVIVGNPRGLRRLAVELLKASGKDDEALESLTPIPDPELEYIQADELEVFGIKPVVYLKKLTMADSKRASAIGISTTAKCLFGSALVLVALFIIVGIITVSQWVVKLV